MTGKEEPESGFEVEGKFDKFSLRFKKWRQGKNPSKKAVKKLINSLHIAIKSNMSLGEEFYYEYHRLQKILMGGFLAELNAEYKLKVSEIENGYRKEGFDVTTW